MSRIGQKNKNRFGTEAVVIKDFGENVLVEFQDEYHYQLETLYQNFANGQMKNPYDKSIFGIGYIGVGKYNTGTAKQHTLEYYIWRDMLLRCYSEKQRHKHPAYYGICTVCKEWHNFQTFAEWFNQNYYETEKRLHLDKDILIPGNKIYSPETCLLVPQRINMLFTNFPNKNGLPNGVHKTKSGKYQAVYINKKLGTYPTVEEAFKVHAKAKKQAMIDVANEFKDVIPKKTYDAILNYEFDITLDKNYVA